MNCGTLLVRKQIDHLGWMLIRGGAKTLITKINSYKTPTMRDVAAAADVSLSTVSLVVNGKPGVSHDRRERVLKVIKELNYAAGGRKNLTVETKIIGLVM